MPKGSESTRHRTGPRGHREFAGSVKPMHAQDPPKSEADARPGASAPGSPRSRVACTVAQRWGVARPARTVVRLILNRTGSSRRSASSPAEIGSPHRSTTGRDGRSSGDGSGCSSSVQGGEARARRQILRHLSAPPLARVLEVGIGDGENLALLPRTGPSTASTSPGATLRLPGPRSRDGRPGRSGRGRGAAVRATGRSTPAGRSAASITSATTTPRSAR